jgi:hypothetical protein
MPLRDHFRPPVDDRHMWEELHAGWPAMIVIELFGRLPPGYISGPIVRRGGPAKFDERGQASPAFIVDVGAVSPTWTAPAPTLTVEAEMPDQDEYEVRLYDANRGRRLVAAIELVSPSNKDRPERRRAFVAKIAALLQQDVCVSVVDVVTTRHANLYGELLQFIGVSDPAIGPEPPPVYAATVRGRRRDRRKPVVDLWYYPLALGKPLPPLPLWLDVDLGVTLDLEASYEETCRVLHIA